MVAYPSVSASPVAEEESDNTAIIIGGTAVGVVGIGAIAAGAMYSMRPLQRPRTDDRDRDKEPSEEELRERAAVFPGSQRRDDSDDSKEIQVPRSEESAIILLAFRRENVGYAQRILSEHGAVYEIIRGHQ